MDRTRSNEVAAALTAAIEQAATDLSPAPAWVACSGGLDSTVLMHCAARSAALRARGLAVVHVHHGLHADAEHWAQRVQAQAGALGLRCELRRVRVDPRGRGLEAAARAARLAAFEDVLGAGEALLLAHHRDDQAETVLLRALRGTSVDGLGAMRARRALGRGWLLRPWLAQPRTALRAAAAALGLDWVEDPANADPRHDRSWLRQSLWPLLQARFPAAGERLARLAGHAAGVSEHIEALAAQTLEALRAADGSLAVGGLLALDQALCGATLRRHARERGVAPPGFHELACLRAEVLGAAIDATPVRHWDGHEYRRYRDRLYLLAPTDTRAPEDYELEWPAGAASLALPAGLGELALFDPQGAPRGAPAGLRVRKRRGGECLRPAGRAHTRELRLLFQERGVPPWQRERVPLLWRDQELLAAVGVAHSAACAELGQLCLRTPQRAGGG